MGYEFRVVQKTGDGQSAEVSVDVSVKLTPL